MARNLRAPSRDGEFKPALVYILGKPAHRDTYRLEMLWAAVVAPGRHVPLLALSARCMVATTMPVLEIHPLTNVGS